MHIRRTAFRFFVNKHSQPWMIWRLTGPNSWAWRWWRLCHCLKDLVDGEGCLGSLVEDLPDNESFLLWPRISGLHLGCHDGGPVPVHPQEALHARQACSPTEIFSLDTVTISVCSVLCANSVPVSCLWIVCCASICVPLCVFCLIFCVSVCHFELKLSVQRQFAETLCCYCRRLWSASDGFEQIIFGKPTSQVCLSVTIMWNPPSWFITEPYYIFQACKMSAINFREILDCDIFIAKKVRIGVFILSGKTFAKQSLFMWEKNRHPGKGHCRQLWWLWLTRQRTTVRNSDLA